MIRTVLIVLLAFKEQRLLEYFIHQTSVINNQITLINKHFTLLLPIFGCFFFLRYTKSSASQTIYNREHRQDNNKMSHHTSAILGLNHAGGTVLYSCLVCTVYSSPLEFIQASICMSSCIIESITQS